MTAFWVQIHNLSFPLQIVETTFSIGETIGSVIKLKYLDEMLGANFMRVMVIVDVSKRLCRGRKISWDVECEGWAAFMYEGCLIFVIGMGLYLTMTEIAYFGCIARVL